jgi:hypothetical protein
VWVWVAKSVSPALMTFTSDKFAPFCEAQLPTQLDNMRLDHFKSSGHQPIVGASYSIQNLLPSIGHSLMGDGLVCDRDGAFHRGRGRARPRQADIPRGRGVRRAPR